MNGSKALLCTLVLLPQLYGEPVLSPIPHWMVLLAVVPSLWVAIGISAVAIDRLLSRLES